MEVRSEVSRAIRMNRPGQLDQMRRKGEEGKYCEDVRKECEGTLGTEQSIASSQTSERVL